MVDDLGEFLESVPPGEISDSTRLESLLAGSWETLPGNDDGGMKPEKLLGRMERVIWDPPILHFTIERHGAVVLGSSRAELQNWEVNVEHWSVSLLPHGYRQIRPKESPLRVEPIAEEIADLIASRSTDDRVRWKENGSVQVLAGKIISEKSPKQTVSNRRKRFRVALTKCLTERAWKEIRANFYESVRAPTELDASETCGE